MLLAHKIQLIPNNKQANYFAQAAGVARLAWNWGLSEWKAQYREGIREVLPKFKPVEMEALATCSLSSETAVCEAGNSQHC